MTIKDIAHDRNARLAFRRGLDALADAVKVTLGPRGRFVAIERAQGSPTITKDGVTVAREIDLPSRMENLGARLVKEVASRTDDVTGDGTTTATVLTQAIYAAGLRLVEAGLDGMELKRGLETALAAIRIDLKAQATLAKTREQVVQVATISSNGDAAVGELLAKAIGRVGKDGVVMVEESKAVETKLNWVEGMQFDRGYLSPHFITDQKRLTANLDNPFILVVGGKVQTIAAILPTLEIVRRARGSLLVIAEDVTGDALPALTLNKLKNVIPCAAVKAPGFGGRRGDYLEDIAIAVGATVFSLDAGRKPETVCLADLGRAAQVVLERDVCRIVQGAGNTELIMQRMRVIAGQIESAKSNYEKDKNRERLARLGAGIALIQVGGHTETDVRARRHLVEDALAATRSAMRDGFLPGGGVALLRARARLIPLLPRASTEQRAGIQVLYDACAVPLRQIACNAGLDGAVVVHKVAEGQGSFGFDARALEYCDVQERGIMDPFNVVDAAIEKAVSVASLMLTSGALIVERSVKLVSEQSRIGK